MKTFWITLLVFTALGSLSTADAEPATLTNHAAAATFLDEFEQLTGTNFHANLRSQDRYHFDGGRKLLAYMQTHPDDTNIAERVTTLAKSWANMERANAEQDGSSRLAHVWQMRTHFAWTILMSKNMMIREGMNYIDAVELLGRPRNHHDVFVKDTDVIWVLGCGLRSQTWIQAKVDSTGIVRELHICRH
jgi:hypothetical protein